MPEQIRAIAICVFLHDEKILVGEGFDEVKQDAFYRPLGGGIEFGEHSTETIAREMKEEIDADITHPEFLGVLESIFTYNGQQGHQAVFVYDAKFVDPKFYKMERIPTTGEDVLQYAVWKPLSFFISGEGRLVPDGLLQLLMK